MKVSEDDAVNALTAPGCAVTRYPLAGGTGGAFQVTSTVSNPICSANKFVGASAPKN